LPLRASVDIEFLTEKFLVFDLNQCLTLFILYVNDTDCVHISSDYVITEQRLEVCRVTVELGVLDYRNSPRWLIDYKHAGLVPNGRNECLPQFYDLCDVFPFEVGFILEA
jgi:hypothetical protein